jgi:hypothetical protein
VKLSKNVLPAYSSSGNQRKDVPFGFTEKEVGGYDLVSIVGFEGEGDHGLREGIIELIADRKEFADEPRFGIADVVTERKAGRRKKNRKS